MTRDEYFLMSIKSVLLLVALMAFGLLYDLLMENQNQSFCLLQWKYLLILENLLVTLFKGYLTLRQWECKQEAALDPEKCCGIQLWYYNGENRPIAENQRRKSTNGKEEELDKNVKILNDICLLHNPLYSLHMHNSTIKGSVQWKMRIWIG